MKRVLNYVAIAVMAFFFSFGTVLVASGKSANHQASKQELSETAEVAGALRDMGVEVSDEDVRYVASRLRKDGFKGSYAALKKIVSYFSKKVKDRDFMLKKVAPVVVAVIILYYTRNMKYGVVTVGKECANKSRAAYSAGSAKIKSVLSKIKKNNTNNNKEEKENETTVVTENK